MDNRTTQVCCIIKAIKIRNGDGHDIFKKEDKRITKTVSGK